MKFKEIQPGNTEHIEILVCNITEKTTKSGSPYCEFTISDGDEKVIAKKWDTSADMFPDQFFVAECDITVSEYNGKPDFKIVTLKQTDGDITNYVVGAPIDPEKMYSTILAHISKTIPDNVIYENKEYDSLGKLVKVMYENNKEKLLYWSAARSMHHNCYGGLLYHIYRMLQSATMIARVYHSLDIELLLAGVALHDIGKLNELDTNPVGEAEYTVDGSLFGHALIGIEMINEEARNLKIHPEKLRLLKHLLASHHGELAKEAIKKPCLVEGLILHYVDELDANVYKYEEEKKALEPGEMAAKFMFGEYYTYYHPTI